MVFGRFLGGTTVDTKYSFAELVRRLHISTEYLNGLMKEYASKVSPMERANTLGKILFQMLRFGILQKKLVAAYLKMVASDVNNAPAYFLKNPQHQGSIEGTYEQFKKNLKGVIEDQSGDRPKSHYLRRFARELTGRANSSRKSIKQKIAAAQKQQAESRIREEHLTAKHQQEHAISGKKPQFIPRFGH
jgi:hypothetical protein